MYILTILVNIGANFAVFSYFILEYYLQVLLHVMFGLGNVLSFKIMYSVEYRDYLCCVTDIRTFCFTKLKDFFIELLR